MNKLNIIYFSKMRVILVLIVIVFFQLCFSQSGNLVPFKQRASLATPSQLVYSIKGNFNLIGNSNITLLDYNDDFGNAFTEMVFIDIDNDDSTINSSSAELTIPVENASLPDCNEILFAGLYWTGRSHNAGPSPIEYDYKKYIFDENNVKIDSIEKHFDKRKIKIKGPLSSTYTELTANDTDILYPDDMFGNMYSAYIEVTDYVKSNGLGEYFVADMALNEGFVDGTGFYGGWGLVIIYSNPKMNQRDVTLFDGHSFVVFDPINANEFILPITGFKTIPTGPVNLKLGLIAGEGDRNIGGDQFLIQRNDNGIFEPLQHSLNSVDNFFNSSINTGGNVRNPDILNNMGLDVVNFTIPNPSNSIIGNNQTSVNFKYLTTQDTYIIPTIAMSVDTFKPEAEAIISINKIDGISPIGMPPYTVKPGQEIEYKIQLINIGNDAVENVKIEIPIPFSTSYVSHTTPILDYPSSPNYTLPTPNTVNFQSIAGTNGKIVWNLGDFLPIRDAATNFDPYHIWAEMTYKLKITENCLILKSPECKPIIEAESSIEGLGVISKENILHEGVIELDITSCEGKITRGNLTTNIDSEEFVLNNCVIIPDFKYERCLNNIVTYDEVISQLPPDTKIYSEFPITSNTIEYTSTNPFPTNIGTTKFAIVPASSRFCFIPMEITYNPKVTANFSGLTPVCFSNSIPIVTLTGSNGTAPYTFTYSYLGIENTITTSSTSNSVNIPFVNNVAGTHTFILKNIKDAKSCEQSVNEVFNLVINPLPTASISGGITECIGTSKPQITFTAENGTAPYTFQFSLNGVNSSITTTSTSNIVTLSPPNSVGIYTFELQSVKDANGCEQAQSGSQIITLNSIPSATISSDKTEVCFGETNPQITFTGANGTAPYTFVYTINGGNSNQVTSLTNTISINSESGVGTYVYNLISVSDVNSCNSVVVNQTVSIKINELPTLNTITEIVCDEDFDTIINYNLTDLNTKIIANSNNFDFRYFENQSDATLGVSPIPNFNTYSLLMNPSKTIWIEVRNKITGCKNVTFVDFVKGKQQNIASTTLNVSCATGELTQDGFGFFNLTSSQQKLNPNGTNFTFYLTENDAKTQNSNGKITNPTNFLNTQFQQQRVWVRITEPNTCDAINFLDLQVEEFPIDLTISKTSFCVNSSVILTATPNQKTYQWYFNNDLIPGATNNELEVNKAGNYTIKIESQNLCKYEKSIEVTTIEAPVIVDVLYGNGTIEIIGSGIPPFYYSINDGPKSDMNFYTLKAGLYRVRIYNDYCAGDEIPIPVLTWPTIFTPNADGKNDTFTISGMENITNGSVNIFDRYGKEIKQLNESNQFIWDGKYLNRALPSTTYWFLMNFTNPYLNKSYKLNDYIVIKNRNDGDNNEFNRVK